MVVYDVSYATYTLKREGEDMAHLFTIDHIIQSTSLLWLLLAAVWLGSAPFVKPTAT